MAIITFSGGHTVEPDGTAEQVVANMKNSPDQLIRFNIDDRDVFVNISEVATVEDKPTYRREQW